MELHTLRPRPGATHRSKRLGRGRASGKGKTSGKGHKGQMARKGHKHKLAFEGGQMPLIRRIPKRGFTQPGRREWLGINVGRLTFFEDGAAVGPADFRRAGMARGRADGIKILGSGALDRRLTVTADAFSAAARAKIEAAGGTCVLTETAGPPADGQ